MIPSAGPHAGADSADGPGQPAQQKERKKVRLACQRCRDRRIKCDGQVPSCSKCAKAGLPCIDVDARQAGSAVRRGFLNEAQARLEWLEGIVRAELPNVDLLAGPQRPDETSEPVDDTQDETYVPAQAETLPHVARGTARGTKRRQDGTAPDPSGPALKSARRMAMDLGLFSLHPNASQAHYLGSSSGSLFARLLHNSSSAPLDPYSEENNADEASDPDIDGSDDSGEKRTTHLRSSGTIQTLQAMLPPRVECDRMIKRFFAYYHAEYPLLHQPSFQSLVDALYASAKANRPAAVQFNGWPSEVPVFRYNDEVEYVAGQEAIPISIGTAAAQLFFVLSIASHLKTRKRSFGHDPSRFTSQAMSLFQLSLADVTVSSVQSILLCVLQEFLTSEGGSMWILLHIAMSYAIELGLHRCHPVSSRSSALAVHLRRRIFLTLYTLERYISTAQGRPIGFQDDTLDLAMPSGISIAQDNEAAQSDQAWFPYSLAHFEWAMIISELKFCLYRFRRVANRTLSEIATAQQALHSRLDDWLARSLQAVETLPPINQQRFKIKLRNDHCFAIGLLYQPSQACPTPDAAALRRCFDSATQRIQLYDNLYTRNYLCLSWPGTHGIFLAGAMLVYCLWSSIDIRASVSVAEVAKSMRLCSSLLTLGGEWWPLAQRGKRSFEKLADSTIQLLLNPLDQPSSAKTRLPMGGVPMDETRLESTMAGTEWFDVESMLQSFLQNDLQFTDMLDTLDYPSVESFDFGELNV